MTEETACGKLGSFLITAVSAIPDARAGESGYSVVKDRHSGLTRPLSPAKGFWTGQLSDK